MPQRPDPWTAISLVAAALIAAFLVMGPALAWSPPSFRLVVDAPHAVELTAAAVVRAAF
jgi:hypothetical protein